MDSKDKRTVWIVGLSIAGILVFFGIMALWHTTTTKKYIEAGYTRAMLPGDAYAHWVKE